MLPLVICASNMFVLRVAAKSFVTTKFFVGYLGKFRHDLIILKKSKKFMISYSRGWRDMAWRGGGAEDEGARGADKAKGIGRRRMDSRAAQLGNDIDNTFS